MATGNRDSLKQRRLRWWLIPLLLVPIAAGALIHWLRKQLPPPLVSLSLVGFKVTPTNAYAVMSLSNLGPTKIYYNGLSWEGEFKTSDGVLTNRGMHMSVLEMSIGMSSNGTFAVKMPSNATSWRVTYDYTFYHQRNPKLDLYEWIIRSGPPRALAILEPAIRILPMPSGDSGQITTPWLTNLPPAVPAEP